MAIYMSRSGPSIRFAKQGESETFVVPMEQSFNITATQQLQSPIQKMFAYIEEAIIGTAGTSGNSSTATIAKAGLELANLTGFQLGTVGYYAQAWAGSRPSVIPITIKFYRGMNGSWNAKDEVFDPSRKLMAMTVPTQENPGDIIIQGPVPAPLDVLGGYALSLLEGAVSTIVNSNETLRGVANTLIVDPIKSALGTKTFGSITKINNDILSAKTWEISFGWFSGKDNDGHISFIRMSRYIVDTSTIKFGQEMQKIKLKDNTYKYFPTTAEVSLNFVSEDILTSQNFTNPT